MAKDITILTTEIDRIMDALVAHQYSAPTIKIIVDGDNVVIRDTNDMLIDSWTRNFAEQGLHSNG